MLSQADRELRLGKITSSTAAAVLGLSSWLSPLAAWAEIRGELDDDALDDETDDDGGEEMESQHERGHFIEPALLEWARFRVSREVGCDLDLWRPPTTMHPTLPWLAASTDGILMRNDEHMRAQPFAAVEAKTIAGGLDQWGEVGTAQVPAYVEIQARVHMLVHDVGTCWVPVLGPRLQMWRYVVRRDADVEDALVETLGAWHEWHVVGGRQPEATGADEQTLKRLFPKHRAAEIPDDPAIASLVRQDTVLREQLATAKASRSAVRAELMDRLRDAEGCRGDGYSVTWKASKDKTSIDWQAIVREMLDPNDEHDAELIAKHTKVRPGPRVLRTTWRGE